MLSSNLSSTPSARATRAERTRDLFDQLAGGAPDQESIREEIVTENLAVADALAQRYARRGVALEDLTQEARLALVRAVHGFQPDKGFDFLSYAVPTITGSLKRLFRDGGWTVRPPRPIQEAQQQINAVRPELTQELGREPGDADLAERTGLEAQVVREALAATDCFTPVSLDAPVGGEAHGANFGDFLGNEDDDLARSEIRTALAPLLSALGTRDRHVLRLRFVEGLSQREVGEQIGVSQMQVSRILSRICGRLRDQLGEVPEFPRAA